MRIKLPFVFSQVDTRWGMQLLGFNTSGKYNIANYGCLISCLAMVSKYYGKDETPLTINNKLKSVSGFKAGGGDYIWGSLPRVFGDIKETLKQTPTVLDNSQIDEIKTALDKGYPVMIGLDFDPKDVDYDSHFVLIVDYNPADENDFTIADPINGTTRSLKAYLGWFKPSARATIEKYVIYAGKVPTDTGETITISSDHYKLYTRNHDEWHKIVHYLLPEADPNATTFENCQSVIAGIKSTVSTLDGRIEQLEKDLSVSKTETENKSLEIGRLNKQLLDKEKQYLADSEALKSTVQDYINLNKQWEGRLKSKDGELSLAYKRIDELKLELSAEKNKIISESAIKKITNYILNIFK